QYDVLVCSTIIETGIDIPNANTIIIDRADKFGLAQLHQLRGRVGRSHHQAYAYLLTADTLKKDAKQRLEAIEYASDLGSGFFLAMQDLEIRGSGEILGDNQSGEMLKVGLTLYSEMLKKAVKALEKGEKLDSSSPLEVNSEIKLYAPALLSASYIPGVDNRLVFYKKLAKAKSEKDLNEVAEQMIDRFGLQPQEVKLLFTSHRLRLQAEALGIARIIATSDKILFKFSKNNKIDVEQLVRMIQEEPQIYRLKEGHDLMVHQGFSEVEKRVKAIEQILNKLNSIE
ncbi:MAG: transcription-repair coupling factor, partial [Haemophilus parainfluenzae]